MTWRYWPRHPRVKKGLDALAIIAICIMLLIGGMVMLLLLGEGLLWLLER